MKWSALAFVALALLLAWNYYATVLGLIVILSYHHLTHSS